MAGVRNEAGRERKAGDGSAESQLCSADYEQCWEVVQPSSSPSANSRGDPSSYRPPGHGHFDNLVHLTTWLNSFVFCLLKKC